MNRFTRISSPLSNVSDMDCPTTLVRNPIKYTNVKAMTRVIKISTVQSIYFQDVEYLEAQNKNVLVTLKDGSVISIKEPFHQCETIFTVEKGFYKCHRSYIAALSCVEKVGKTSLFTKSGAQLPISRDNYANFKDVYFSYMFPQE